MPEIRPLADIARKWGEVTPARASEYQAGVQNPKRDWAENTAAAEGAYEDGVQAAIQDKRFGRGVRDAGTGKWQKKAVELGVARWPAGVRAAQSDYQNGFAPYHDVIARTTLPPRFGRGDPRNYQRSEAMGTALHEARVRGGR